MICPYCGKDVPDGASFCGNCGSPMYSQGTGNANASGYSDAYNYFEGNAQQGAGQNMAGDGYQNSYQGGYQSGYQNTAGDGYQSNYQGGYQDGYQNNYQSGYQNSYQQAPGGNMYQNNGYYAPPVNHGAGTYRSIPVCVILSIVTMGIYGLYWFVVLTDEMNRLSGDTEATSGGMALVFTIITCGIYGIYWAYKMGEKVDRVKGQMGGSSPVLFLILEIFGLGIVNWCLIQDTLNKY